MTNMTSIEKAKDLVIKAGIKLVETGLIARTWGNVSHRISENRFVITPSGKDYRSLTPEDIVIVQIKDCSYSGNIKPSSEKGVHSEVYKRFPNVDFVIHTHQEYASVISACGLDAIKINNRTFCLSNEVICASYALPSTKKLQRNVAFALSQSKGRAVILKNHGALCYGKDAEEAFMAAEELESTCRNYLEAEYRKQTRNQHLNRAELSRYVLSMDTAAASNEVEVRKKYFNSRRLDDGLLLYDGNTEIKAQLNEGSSFLPGETYIYQTIFKKNKDIQYISWNLQPEIVEFAHTNLTLLPMLDDFAQIIGASMEIVEINPSAISAALKRRSAVFVRNIGALCCGSSSEDVLAVNMVLEKNCKAFISANLFGKVKPIPRFESLLMRFIYLKKYSKHAYQTNK